MKKRRFRHGGISCLPVVAVVLLSIVFPAVPGRAAKAHDEPETVAGLPPAEVLRLGERMYVEGVLPSGKTMQAIVQGDIPVEGGKFTCANCHQRSGFGSEEGWVRTPPIDGTRLYTPMSSFKGMPVERRRSAPQEKQDVFRPAYTDKTLATVMRTGVDPAGRRLADVMPKYLLDDRDMAILVYYLRHLSSGTEPGVTDTHIRFATIVTDDVPKEDRDAMVRPLRLYLTKWRISRNMERMARTESFIREGVFRPMRKFALDVWELKGPSDTWQSQLEEYYRKEPVFALLGGITTAGWEPIHRFCEDHRIPEVFPITDFPVISETDWYTMYLSEGLSQEGRAAAEYLNTRSDLVKKTEVVQVFRKDRAGSILSKSFQETWTGLGHKAPANVALDLAEPLTAAFWEKLAAGHKHAVFLAWLDLRDFPALDRLAKGRLAPRAVFASFSLLGKGAFSLPETVRSSVYITYPYTMPQNAGRFRNAMEKLVKSAESPARDLFIGYKMQALRLALIGPLSRMRSYVYRNYFLELLDGTADLSMIPVPYPRLSFGQGQRYASKGCYIVQLSDGPDPEFVRRSEWVIR